MNTILSPFLALPLGLLLCSCNPGTSVSTDGGRINANGKSVTLHADGQPEAKITVMGDLLIDGQAITVDPAQRVLLQAYHKEMNAMTADGIAIGKQGAKLAGKAVSEAIKGAINGNADDVESKVEAEAAKIEESAMRLCKRLVTVKASQDALAASLPEFKPYATIDHSDVDDCGSDQNDSYNAGKDAGGSLARAMKGENDGERGMDAAEQAEAAGASKTEAAADDNTDSR